MYADWDYWGKPVPGFGDPEAQLLVVGLAPAAHGGNRTGRMFTGDGSADWLIEALYEFGFANQPRQRTGTTVCSCTARTSPRPPAARRRKTGRRPGNCTTAGRFCGGKSNC